MIFTVKKHRAYIYLYNLYGLINTRSGTKLTYNL